MPNADKERGRLSLLVALFGRRRRQSSIERLGAPISVAISDAEAGTIGRRFTYENPSWETQVTDVWKLVDSILLLRDDLRISELRVARAKGGLPIE